MKKNLKKTIEHIKVLAEISGHMALCMDLRQLDLIVVVLKTLLKKSEGYDDGRLNEQLLAHRNLLYQLHEYHHCPGTAYLLVEWTKITNEFRDEYQEPTLVALNETA